MKKNSEELNFEPPAAEIDFETYSEAGYDFDTSAQRWKGGGLAKIGIARYATHHTTEILSLAYDLKDFQGPKVWTPDKLPPVDLFSYLNSGGLLEAWNMSFEYWIWQCVAVRRYNFPSLFRYQSQLRCARAKAKAFSLPGRLVDAGAVLNTVLQKDKIGKPLLKKLSRPRDPTKTDSRLRVSKIDSPDLYEALYHYNVTDIQAEAAISALCPRLSDSELRFWQCDQAINRRGVAIDLAAIQSIVTILRQAESKYNKQLSDLTDGKITSAGQVVAIVKYINEIHGEKILANLAKNSIDQLLNSKIVLPNAIKKILEIRSKLNSASVKKINSMLNMQVEGRLYELFIYHGARTGRATGANIQPQNLPRKKIDVLQCGCTRIYPMSMITCPSCGKVGRFVKFDQTVIRYGIDLLKTGNLQLVEYYFTDAYALISSCLRSLFIAGPGKKFICSDYSAIEAVVLAALAGETWRLNVFKSHGRIYEASASKITGVPLEEILAHEKKTGESHPLRQLGKIAELSSGYQGGLASWKTFGADRYFESEDEIKQKISAWRRANPNIVNLWYESERSAKSAILYPGIWFEKYYCFDNILYCRLKSSRLLVYHTARLEPGKFGDQIVYDGWNTNPAYGKIGWTSLSTYGGKLVENETQATARDILAHAIIRLEEKGYPVVLHVHDEIVCETLDSETYCLRDVEGIMSTMPEWAVDWPIKAAKGWEGHRYRK